MNPPSHDYFNYLTKLYSAAMLVDPIKINEAFELLLNKRNNVAIMGNGGSAAVAEHFCCDFVKGVRHDTNLLPRCTSLVSNGPVLTAIANDYGYNYIFSKQIEYIEPTLVIAVSSSGNSKNIIEGLRKASSLCIRTIALVGFDGGAVLKEQIADVVVHVNSDNYGIVEDSHMMILHSLVQKIRTEFATDLKNLKL